MFDEKIVLIQGSANQYGVVVCNADGSAIGGGSANSTPYTMLAYYDTSDANYDYEYYAEATPGSSTSDLAWRCFRIQNDKDGNFISKKWAGIVFNHLGDETSVKGYTYS